MPDKFSSNAIKAIGERIVANELTFRGWIAVNVNSGEENAPNIDLIALKNHKRITIQVKTTSAQSHKDQFFLGYHRENGSYFNEKAGPKADFLACVYIHSPKNYSCLVIPISKAEKLCINHGLYWVNKPKRNGDVRSPKFPVFVGVKHSKEYKFPVQDYVDAWHQLDVKP